MYGGGQEQAMLHCSKRDVLLYAQICTRASQQAVIYERPHNIRENEHSEN